MKKALVYIGLLVLGLSVSGCVHHTSMIDKPMLSVPDAYSTHDTTPSPPIGRWWEQFEDEELNLLIESAFQHNFDIAQAYERLLQSDAVFRKTKAARGLSLTIEGSGNRSRQSGFFRGSSEGGFGATTFNSYTLSGAARYELDLWGKLKSNAEASRSDLRASEHDLKAVMVSISAQLADLYYLAAEQRAQIELSDQSIASFKDTLERVEQRYRGGLVPAIDVYQARQNLSAAKAQKPVFESALAVTRNSLAVLAGKFPNQETGGSTTELDRVPRLNEGIPSQLLTRRPDIAASLERLRASDERVGAAIADRFPSFNLSGNYGGTSDELNNILDSPNIFWNILLQITQPVIDWGRRKAEVSRTEAVSREHLAAYHKTVLNAFKEVEDALAKISASDDRIQFLREQVDSSDSALALSLDNYLQGLTDYLPVLTEQLRNVTAKSNLLTSRRQFISDRIQLARALGGSWADDLIRENNEYTISELTTEEKER